MHDIIFCSLPYSNLDHIYSAPAILKGVAVSNGYSAKTVDFGCELLNLLDKNLEVFNKTQVYFISSGNGDPALLHNIEKFYSYCIDFFRKNPSKFIGISVLSIYTHRAVYELCQRIRKENINSQIVIGGRGAKVPAFFSVSKNYKLTATEKMLEFGMLLKNRQLVDHVIIGDGEDAILKVLEDTPIQVDTKSDEFQSLTPDYFDYNFKDYLFDQHNIMLPITGSKGCVRECDFCDVKFHFGKYKYRSGKDIANEMIAVAEKTNIRRFQFTDSLVNGGLKPFKEFIEILSEYNLKYPDKKIQWNGQYICRPPQETPKEIYQFIKDSGGHGLTIGAESGSNRVLHAMNKKTTVEALYAELENFRIHNITCTLLTFVGHWSETWEDFVEHCRMFINLLPYVRSGTISAVSLGQTYYMLDGTPSMFNHEINNIFLHDKNKEYLWFNKNNPTNTFKERLYRQLIVYAICKNFNIPLIGHTEFLITLADIINHSSDEINKFYEKFRRELVF